MAPVSFTISAETCARLYDALICLARFSETVSIEARQGQLMLSALNSSKSAYALFILEKHRFFQDYQLSDEIDKFTCRILNKALLSVFKGRLHDPRSEEHGVERCDFTVEDEQERGRYRLMVTLHCRQGVTKIHRLTYESTDVMQAIFDKGKAVNRWTGQAKMLRSYMEYFGPRTEQLDIYAEDGQVILTSYTEKIVHGKEVLKQPLQTAVTIDASDFEDFHAEEKLHIAISVKDFRNIILHADGLRTSVTALYSQPAHPLQFSYGAGGMQCEFTLMTIGDFRNSSASSTLRSNARENTNGAPTRTFVQSRGTNMPPPAARQSSTPSQAKRLGSRQMVNAVRTDPAENPESLFLPEDDDSRWDPQEDRGEDDDMLAWDASADNNGPGHGTFRDYSTASQTRDDNAGLAGKGGIEATQHASQVRGLFD